MKIKLIQKLLVDLPNLTVLDIFVHKDELFISGIDKNSDCKNEALDEDSNVTTKIIWKLYNTF